MKELSIKEKAKRYDEAIEKLRNAFYDNNSRMCEEYRNAVIRIIEPIFPELKESEDELTWLTKYIEEEAYSLSMDIRDNEDRVKLKNLQRSLAWLERQGESIKIKKGKNYLCTKTHKYAGVEWIEGVKYYSPKDCFLVNQGYTYYCSKYSKEKHTNFFKEVEYDSCLEKQGEQKPIDKVELKLRVKYAGSEYNVLELKNIAGVIFYGIEDKPNHIDYVLPNDCEIVSEQNPAWSEEDENHIQHISDFIMRNRVGDTDAIYRLEQDVNWLKSLKDRYTWKPSAKQIYELTKAVDYYTSHGFPNKILNELLKQLKNL